MRQEPAALEPEALIASLQLARHPEGGWYREVHRSEISVQRLVDGQRRDGLTVILYLLTDSEFSRWHRVSGADELWQHCGGAPLDLWCLPPEGGEAERLSLGPLDPALPWQRPLQVIPAGCWQAARSSGPWSLMSCAVGPGFAFADFSLMRGLPPERRPPGADPGLL
jgi:predicted cupin superfamily sugar epimerase